MTRRHGRCARGDRLVAKAQHGRWRTLTFLAALRCNRIAAPCVIDGPINRTSFRAYVEQFLVPALNLGSHKIADAYQPTRPIRGQPVEAPQLAVALIAGISRAHAFEQGNKRTAFGAMRLFLRINGYDTAFDDSVSWADEIISLVEHRLTEEDFAGVLRPFVVLRPKGAAAACPHFAGFSERR
jgi:prophage maintenance system killer protein